MRLVVLFFRNPETKIEPNFPNERRLFGTIKDSIPTPLVSDALFFILSVEGNADPRF